MKKYRTFTLLELLCCTVIVSVMLIIAIPSMKVVIDNSRLNSMKSSAILVLDLAVNVVKGKQLTNTRAAGSDHTVVLKRPRPITLEYCLDYINTDELVEITPHFLRLRKKILNTESRKKFDAKKNG